MALAAVPVYGGPATLFDLKKKEAWLDPPVAAGQRGEVTFRCHYASERAARFRAIALDVDRCDFRPPASGV
jgi:hypothetical protein